MDDDDQPRGAGYLNEVSCPKASACMAVGSNDANSPLIETSSGGNWAVTTNPAVSSGQLDGVSCPKVKPCLAAGNLNGLTLLERYA